MTGMPAMSRSRKANRVSDGVALAGSLPAFELGLGCLPESNHPTGSKTIRCALSGDACYFTIKVNEDMCVRPSVVAVTVKV